MSGSLVRIQVRPPSIKPPGGGFFVDKGLKLLIKWKAQSTKKEQLHNTLR